MIKFAWRVLLVEFDAMYLFFSVIYRTLKELFPQNLMAKLKPIETYEPAAIWTILLYFMWIKNKFQAKFGINIFRVTKRKLLRQCKQKNDKKIFINFHRFAHDFDTVFFWLDQPPLLTKSHNSDSTWAVHPMWLVVGSQVQSRRVPLYLVNDSIFGIARIGRTYFFCK